MNASCVNMPGSLNCTCKAGFTGNGLVCADIDECLDSQPCPAPTLCHNTAGSFRCECPTVGYFTLGVKCKDIDECLASVHGCQSEEICVNTAGSYRCEPQWTWVSYPAASGNNQEPPICSPACHSNAICVGDGGVGDCKCLGGYRGVGSIECLDVDECGEGKHNCPENALCRNTEGSFHCECLPGFHFAEGNKDSCVEMESDCDGNHNCHANATCVDEDDGVFECRCKRHFTGNGTFCQGV